MIWYLPNDNQSKKYLDSIDIKYIEEWNYLKYTLNVEE